MSIVKKLACVALTIFTAAYSSAQDTIFSKSYNGQDLAIALREVEEYFEINLSYVEDIVSGITINKKVQANTWNEALEKVLDDTGLVFHDLNNTVVLSKRKKHLYTINGYVRDEETKEGIPGATVWVSNQLTGAVTDLDGYFELLIEEGVQEVQTSFVGFQSRLDKVEVAEGTKMEITMKEDQQVLKTVEVVANSFEISKGETSTHTISRKEILYSPAPFRGIFRTLKILPGFSNDDISAKARIRGGHWDETAVFLDGLEIYEPFHLEEVEGLAGIFETDLIRNVKVQTGGFTPRYTDKLSGIIEMETSEYLEKNEASISVDFLAAKAILQQRTGKNSNLIFSARRGYLDLILDTENEGIKPTYFDLFGKYTTRLDKNNTLTFDLLYAQDDILFDREDGLIRSEYFNSHRKNLYIWANWKWLLNKRFFTHTTFGFQSLNKDATFAFESSLKQDNRDFVDVDIYSLVNRTYWEGWDSQKIEFGIEVKHFNAHYIFDEVRINPSVPNESFISTDIIDLNSKPNGTTGSAYLQSSWSLIPKLTLLYGARLSAQSFTDNWQLAPRSILTYVLSNRLSTSVSYGLYFQPDNIQKLRSYIGQSSPFKRVARSEHYNVNLTHQNTKLLTKFNFYYKNNTRLFDDYRYDFYNRASLASFIETPFNTVSGKSMGFEVFSRLNLSNHLISLAYALSENTIVNAAGEETARDFDRLHSLSLNSIFNFKRNFSFSATWNYYSGGPYTPNQISFVGEPKFNSDAILYYDFGTKNSARMPAYHSLDIKIEKTIISKKSSFNFYLSILNLYNRVNKRNYSWNADRTDENGNRIYKRSFISGPNFFVSPGIKLSF